MTPDQQKQWDNFGCMSEALIYAAKITPDEYRTKYDQYFPFSHQYGGLILSRFILIAEKLGLGTNYDLIWRYQTIRENFNKGILVFVFSGVRLNHGHSDDISHVSVLENIEDTWFKVTGFDRLCVGDWVGKRCCGIVLWK